MEATCAWLTTEALLTSAQDHVMNTRYHDDRMHSNDISPKCRLCGDKNERIQQKIAGCTIMANTEYKKTPCCV